MTNQYGPLLTPPTAIPHDSRLIDLQRFQRDHDERYHRDVDCFPRPRQFWHNQGHIAKINGRIAQYRVAQREGVCLDLIVADLKQRRIPDALCFTLKLANLVDMDLGLVFGRQYGLDASSRNLYDVQQLLERRPLDAIADDLVVQGGTLADLCDKNDHGEVRDHVLSMFKGESIPSLLRCAIDLANIYDIDLARAYLERIRDGEHNRRL